MLAKETTETGPLLHSITEFQSCFSGWMTLRLTCGRTIVVQELVDTSKRRAMRPTCEGCAPPTAEEKPAC